jgi:hypothetical protein
MQIMRDDSIMDHRSLVTHRANSTIMLSGIIDSDWRMWSVGCGLWMHPRLITISDQVHLFIEETAPPERDSVTWKS